MMMITPIKVGKTGKIVHAGRVIEERQRGHWTQKIYRPLCTVTNTHNVNDFPTAYTQELNPSTAITCKKCLAKMKEKETK